MKVLVFGNALVEKDSLPLKILPNLKKSFPEIEFKELDAAEDVEKEGRNLLIIDSAEGIKETALVGIDSIEIGKIYSLHDFDLGYTLKLLKKMDRIGDARIIAVPVGMEEKKAFSQVQFILRKCVAQLMQGS